MEYHDEIKYSRFPKGLLIWDSDETVPEGYGLCVLWKRFQDSENPQFISLPQFVEENAVLYKQKYLSWVYELGEQRVGRSSLIEYLKIKSDFSYWWLTSIAQKFNAADSSQINNAIKTIALEKIVSDFNPSTIVLKSENYLLQQTLNDYCSSLGISFALYEPKKRISLVKHYIHSAHEIKAIGFFFWFSFKNLVSLQKSKSFPKLYKGTVTFIDILVHLDNRVFNESKFYSNYWTKLIDKLYDSGIECNWMHQFFPHHSIPDLRKAQAVVSSLNTNDIPRGSHTLLDGGLTIKVLLLAIFDYLKLSLKCLRASYLKNEYFRPSGSNVNLKYFFRDEWASSLRGPNRMLNLIRFRLFEEIFSNLPKQKMGFYIQENQPWEIILAYNWKQAGHGKLIGVPHTTVRFWDLRYFYDSRTYKKSENGAIPLPDLVAVNGPVAMQMYTKWGYPEKKLVEVEALRFLNITDVKPGLGIPRGNRKRIVICGDFLATTNHKILSCVSNAIKLISIDIELVFKPHPAYLFNFDEYPINIKSDERPLRDVLLDCDLAITSSITSSAVDAYTLGIPVVQLLDGNFFNMTALRDIEGVTFVSNEKQMAEAIGAIDTNRNSLLKPYFNLDANLPLWSALLKS